MQMHPTPSSASRLHILGTTPGHWRANAARAACLLVAIAAGMGAARPGVARGDLRPIELQADMLSAHNIARNQVGLGPMVWSPALAADAKQYAGKMSRSGLFAHSGQVPGARPQGENLWMGTRNAYSFSEMAESWVDERHMYDGGSIDQAMSDGSFGDIGHYTQIIWRDTQMVGCAVVSNSADDYLVCRYLPAGNVMGSSPLD